MLSTIHSCSVNGIEGFVVAVEVDIARGLPGFNLVGLAETAVKESRDRVKSAIQNSGYTFPTQKVVVNLAPADVKKAGTGFDLPIALAVLSAAGTIPGDRHREYLSVGELSLDGSLKPVKASLSYALLARESGYRGIILPRGNASEAALIKDVRVIAADHLSGVVDFLAGQLDIAPHAVPGTMPARFVDGSADFRDVRGQHHARRALEVAAAGSHNLLMAGPPGSGKSMMARRLPSILPALSFDQAIEVTRVYSIMGLTDETRPFLQARPFRSPHHTISDAGLVGGGSRPMPGEISLAHHGVLFLDELPEFKRNVLEVLRQPLEDGTVSIARAGAKAVYPSRFMLVGAMNPCPCGHFFSPEGRCRCSPAQVQAYHARISGPLLDRMDIQIEVPAVNFNALSRTGEGETSAAMAERVETAWQIQEKRFRGQPFFSNSDLGGRMLESACVLDREGRDLLAGAADRFSLSARACHAILRVARTIADLAGSETISPVHLKEAIQYRSFDRFGNA